MLLVAAIAASIVGSHIDSPRVFFDRVDSLIPNVEFMREWTVIRRPVAETEELKKSISELLNFDDGVLMDFSRGESRVSLYVAYWTPGRMAQRLGG